MLIIVLWISLGLAAVAFTFAHSTQMAYRGADNELAGRQAEQAIEGAARYAESIMSNLATPGIMPELTAYESAAVPIGAGTFWFIGAPDATAIVNTGVSSGPVFGLVDEASKINLNMAVDPAHPTDKFDMLRALPGMTDELAGAIVDWVDTDDDVSDNGAESETYALRQPAYAAKNLPFESVEELALVNGASFDLLYGEDANLNGVLDPSENDGDESAPTDNSDGKLEPALLSYLTCFSRESNLQADGTTLRVNVASTSPGLATLLSSKISEARSQEILTNMAPFYGVGGRPPKSIMEFYIDSGMTADELALLIGSISVSTDKFIEGRINVNTASETVMACIPGVDPSKASALVATRSQRQAIDESIAWFRDALGDDVAATRAGPYITGRVSQFSADVAAVGRKGRGYRRTRFIIDNSTGTPQIVFRRDLSGLGWALGSEVRQALLAAKEAR